MGLKELSELSLKIQEEIESTIKDEINSSLTAFGSIIDYCSLKKIGIQPVYASSPITTGYAMYSALEKAGVTSIDELKALDPDFRKKIMKLNIEDGINFGDEIRAYGNPIVIVPGIFFAKNWTQEHYMGLWEPVIEKYADKVAYNAHFHYSDGCVEEFLIGLRNDKELRSRENFGLISPKDELLKLEDAINHIEKITGTTPPKLYNLHQKIQTLV